MARDHFKTTMIQIADTCYRALEMQDKALKGIVNVALDDGLAHETYQSIIEHLTVNPLILSFYGCVIDQQKITAQSKKRKFSADTAYFTYQPAGSMPGLLCCSWESRTITGKHPWVMKFDDIMDEPLSPVKMGKFKRIFFKKVLGAMSKTGIIILTGTLKGWDETNDAYLLLERDPDILTYRYPAVVDVETGLASFPSMDDVIMHVTQIALKDKRGNQRLDRFGQPMMRTRRIIDDVKGREKYRVTYPEKFSLEDLILIRLKFRYGEVKIGDVECTDDDFFSEFQLQAANPSGKVFDTTRVFTTPPILEHERRFLDFVDLSEWLHQNQPQIPVYMFVDPGGKDSHGVAYMILAVLSGMYWCKTPKYVVMECGLL